MASAVGALGVSIFQVGEMLISLLTIKCQTH